MNNLANEIQALLSDEDLTKRDRINLLRLRLLADRLNLEEAKQSAAPSFLNKNAVAVLTAAISMAAVVVSGTQVWIAKIQNEKVLDLNRAQAERMLQNARSQQGEDMKVKAMSSFVENRGKLFGDDKHEMQVGWKMFLNTYGPYLTPDLMSELEAIANTPAEKRALRVLRQKAFAPIIRAQTAEVVYSQDPLAQTTVAARDETLTAQEPVDAIVTSISLAITQPVTKEPKNGPAATVNQAKMDRNRERVCYW